MTLSEKIAAAAVQARHNEAKAVNTFDYFASGKASGKATKP